MRKEETAGATNHKDYNISCFIIQDSPNIFECFSAASKYSSGEMNIGREKSESEDL